MIGTVVEDILTKTFGSLVSCGWQFNLFSPALHTESLPKVGSKVNVDVSYIIQRIQFVSVQCNSIFLKLF